MRTIGHRAETTMGSTLTFWAAEPPGCLLLLDKVQDFSYGPLLWTPLILVGFVRYFIYVIKLVCIEVVIRGPYKGPIVKLLDKGGLCLWGQWPADECLPYRFGFL